MSFPDFDVFHKRGVATGLQQAHILDNESRP